jgi:hypothetical protein
VTIYRFTYYRKINAAGKEYAEHLTGGSKVIDQENTKWFRHTKILEKRPKRHPSVQTYNLSRFQSVVPVQKRTVGGAG